MSDLGGMHPGESCMLRKAYRILQAARTEQVLQRRKRTANDLPGSVDNPLEHFLVSSHAAGDKLDNMS